MSHELSETELLARLLPTLPANESVIIGPGDDCAAVDVGIPEQLLLLKTDAVVEGVHFTTDADPIRVGHKALARCCSDIAAMGGTPQHALVTIGLPQGYDFKFVEGFYAGLTALAARHGIVVVGGETTRNPERAFISVALTGTVEKGLVLKRSGAKVGDAIFVTGDLGGSIEGKHLDFEPRIAEGKFLAQEIKPHAMIDVSDGLASDLRHILMQSGVGAELLADALPISRAAKLRARDDERAKPPLVAALTDGEDFELLFTVPPSRAVPTLDRWKTQFPDIRLTCIGKITAETGLRLRDKKGVKDISFHGYDHFAQS